MKESPDETNPLRRPGLPPQRRPPVIPPQRPNVISSEAEKSKPPVGSRGTYGSAALALNPSLSRRSGAGRNPAERGDARMKESPDEINPLSRPGLPPQRRPPVIPPQRPNVISSEAEKSKPTVGSRGPHGSPALALHSSLSRLSGAGRNPGERGDARMKESPDEINPLSRPDLPPQRRPPVIPPQRPNVISSEAEKSKPPVGSRGTYGSAALALNPSLSRLSGAGRNPAERGDARMKESPDEINPLSRPDLPP